MNRYLAAGVAEDVIRGRDVLVVTQRQTEATAIFADVMRHLTDEYPDATSRANVRRANGNEEVSTEFGRARFRSGYNPTSLRGLSADVLVTVGYLNQDDAWAILAGAHRPDAEWIRF